jgi:hypothetical protein
MSGIPERGRPAERLDFGEIGPREFARPVKAPTPREIAEALFDIPKA